jgi:hypothetical protein
LDELRNRGNSVAKCRGGRAAAAACGAEGADSVPSDLDRGVHRNAEGRAVRTALVRREPDSGDPADCVLL